MMYAFKNKSIKNLLITIALCLSPALTIAQSCARPGFEGPVSASGIINSYWPPSNGTYTTASTAIPLGTRTGAAVALAPGDLAMVIQMQCANITTTNSNVYGDGVASTPANGYTDPAGSCLVGRYELVRAGPATTNTSLDLTGSQLSATYVQANATAALGARRMQVIRIPQYSSLTLSGTVTPFAWNGTTGGVVALDVAGNLNFAGQTINATGLGFRGGGGRDRSSADTTVPFTATADTRHASKGEGIVGTPRYVHIDTNPTDINPGTITNNGAQGYPGGDYAKGAPGNAGGGGDYYDGTRDNGGGGGGSNGGVGGFGGYGWRNGGWGGVTYASTPDLRGHPGGSFLGVAATRIVMGGGGGAGDNNLNSTAEASSGAAGGGIVIIHAGSMSGTGTINANGARAPSNTGNDAAGGGGAGGSVLVLSKNSASATLSINAIGGQGGDSFLAGDSAHGPGGGGGGGVVYTNVSASVNVDGGNSGTTNTNDAPPGGAAHGSTAGSTGVSGSPAFSVTSAIADITSSRCIPALSVTKTTTTATRISGVDTTGSYSISITNPATASGTAYGVSLLDNLPDPFTYNAASVAITYTGATGPASVTGSGTDPVTFATAGGTNANSFTMPPGSTVTFSFTVNLNTPPASPTAYQNPAVINFTDPTRTTGSSATAGGNPTTSPGSAMASGETTPGSNYASGSSTAEDITITARAVLTKSLLSNDIPVGGVTTLTFTVDNTATGSVARTGIGFVDTLPTNWRIAATPATSSTGCGTPTITAAGGGTSITTSNIAVAAGAVCTINVNVTHRSGFSNNSCATNPAAWTNSSTNISGLTNTVQNSLSPTCMRVLTAVDLQVVKTGPATAIVNQPITYTLVLTNNTTGVSATNTSLVDNVPVNFTNVTWTCVASGTSDCNSTTGGTGASGSGNAISLSNITLNNGAGNIITITVNATPATVGSITNTAVIAESDLLIDSVSANNTSSVNTTITNIDLSISKSHLPAAFNLSSTGTFSLTVTNNGSATSTGTITVTDPVPNGLVVQSASGTGWSCTITGQTVTCTTASTLAPSASSNAITITVQVHSQSLVQVTNTATVNALYDSDSTNNTASDTVVILSPNEDSFTPDNYKQALRGSFVDHPHTFVAGSAGTLAITATPATPLNSWSYVIYQDTDCSGTITPAEITPWSNQSVVSAQTVCVVLRVFTSVSSSSGQQLKINITSSLTPSSGPVRNITRSDTTVVGDPQQLTVFKEVRNVTTSSPYAINNTASAGQIIEYRITYQNVSYQAINNLVINDSTQPYTTYVSAMAISTPPGLTGPIITAPTVGSTGAITFTFTGSLTPGSSGQVSFRLQISN